MEELLITEVKPAVIVVRSRFTEHTLGREEIYTEKAGESDDTREKEREVTGGGM